MSIEDAQNPEASAAPVDTNTETPPAVQPDGQGGDTPTAENGNAAEYADFSLPEGMTLDTVTLDKFRPIAKELGLSQESAQKLVSLVADQRQAEHEAWAAQIDEWANQSKADPEIGGAKFDENLAIAQRGYTKFATPALRELLDSSGYSNHPEVIRMFVAIGKSFGEDNRPPTGADPARGSRPLHERMYEQKS